MSNTEEFNAKLKRFIISGLRKLSYRWGERYQCLKDARVGDSYKCAKCKKTFSRKDIQIDHIQPVVDPATGFSTWDEYITRLFSYRTNFQVLCKPCHKIKTASERVVRKIVKEKKGKKK